MISPAPRWLAFAFLILLLSFSGAGEEETAVKETVVAVDVLAVTPDVEVGGTALFVVGVTNLGEERDVFKVSGDPYDVSPFSDFVQYVKVQPTQVKLDPNQRKEVKVEVKVLESAVPNKEFTTDVKVSSLTHLEMKESAALTVFVIPTKEVVQISVDAPAYVKPGEEFAFSALFKNRLPVELGNYELSVYSKLPGISQSIVTNFTPKEEQQHSFTFPIELDAVPGDYALQIRVYDGSELKGSFTSAFRVLEKSAVGEKKGSKGGFLKSEMVFMRVNEGNTEVTRQIRVDSNFLKNLFTTTIPEALVKDGDLVWEFTLAPGEEYTAQVVRNYRSLFYGFLVIVAAVVLLYFYIEHSVVIKKRVFMVKSGPEGIGEMKILLLVRNGKRATLEHVTVYDVLPSVIQPTYEFGTLQPNQVQQGKKSKRFVWELGSFQPGEERMLTYRVRAKIHLTEGVWLPAAQMHYTFGGKQLMLVSDRLYVAPPREQSTGQVLLR